MKDTFAGVVFDMDGVLIDSEPIVKRCGQAAARTFGAELSNSLYNNLIGLPAKEVENGLQLAFGSEFPMQSFRDELERLWHEHVANHGMPIKSGVEDLLKNLQAHDVPFAIPTSTPFERAQFSLDTAGILHYFDHIVGGDQVSKGKPEPEIFLAAASLIDISAPSCIAIEDSAVGVRAASSAGMYTIMIPDQKGPDDATKERYHELHSSMSLATARIFELLSRDHIE